MTDRHDRPIHLEAVPPPPEDDYATPTPIRTPRDLAERALLGAMLRTKAACDDVTLTLTTGAAFYQPRHELIYDALIHQYARGYPTDTLAIGDHLEQAGNLTRAGGRAWAIANGYRIATRGAIPAAVKAAYTNQHAKAAP